MSVKYVRLTNGNIVALSEGSADNIVNTNNGTYSSECEYNKQQKG